MKKLFKGSSIIIMSLFFMAYSTIENETTQELKIGSQIWSSKNLNVSHFRNGDEIKQITSDMEWLMADVNKEPAWCYFEFDEANADIYGKLYNGYAVLDKRGLAPKGWKIPTDSDWKTLEAHTKKNANKLKADSTNETGFSALYSGSINVNGGFMPQYFMAWSSSQSKQNKTTAFYRRFNNYNSSIDRKLGKLGSGFAVRCIK